MKTVFLLSLVISMLLIQGCSQRNLTKEKEVSEPSILQIENLDELKQKVNSFINEKYTQDIAQKLSLGINYDTEYINTVNKTEVFIKYKNSMFFCGTGGCSGEMLEYENGTLKHIESFTLINSSIYLIHKLSDYGFEKIVIPVNYIDENEDKAVYYNIYQPFTLNENQSLYPNDIGYDELKSCVTDRKKSIKLFEKIED